jgi:hypothetical protein
VNDRIGKSDHSGQDSPSIRRRTVALVRYALVWAVALRVLATLVSKPRVVVSSTDMEDVAGRIVAAIARSEHQRRRRRFWVVTLGALTLSVFFGLFLIRRPPVDVEIRAISPGDVAQIDVGRYPPDGRFVGAALLQLLQLDGTPGAAGASHQVEVDIPVACQELKTRLRLACGATSAKTKSIPADLLSVHWTRGALLRVRSRGLSGVNIEDKAADKGHNQWAFHLRSPFLKVSASCPLRGTHVVMHVGGLRDEARCLEIPRDDEHLKLALNYTLTPELRLDDVEHMTGQTMGGMVRLAASDTSRATVRVGDLEHGIDSGLAVLGMDRKIGVRLAVTPPERSTLSVLTGSARSVRATRTNEEYVKTVFQRSEDLWAGLIGGFVFLWAGMLVEGVSLRRYRGRNDSPRFSEP